MSVINGYCPQRVIYVLNNIANSSGILFQSIWLQVEASSKLSYSLESLTLALLQLPQARSLHSVFYHRILWKFQISASKVMP